MSSMNNNKAFFVQYRTNQPLKVETHYFGEQERRRPLADVGDLVAAYKTAVAPLLVDSSLAHLTLHLPDKAARSSLSEDCFASKDSAGTTLRTGLALARLNGLGLDDEHPLIIKSSYIQGIAHGLTVGINDFLLNTLADIEKALIKPSTAGTKRKVPKVPSVVGRGEEQKQQNMNILPLPLELMSFCHVAAEESNSYLKEMLTRL